LTETATQSLSGGTCMAVHVPRSQDIYPQCISTRMQQHVILAIIGVGIIRIHCHGAQQRSYRYRQDEGVVTNPRRVITQPRQTCPHTHTHPHFLPSPPTANIACNNSFNCLATVLTMHLPVDNGPERRVGKEGEIRQREEGEGLGSGGGGTRGRERAGGEPEECDRRPGLQACRRGLEQKRGTRRLASQPLPACPVSRFGFRIEGRGPRGPSFQGLKSYQHSSSLPSPPSLSGSTCVLPPLGGK
jgi:hypothetical protein